MTTIHAQPLDVASGTPQGRQTAASYDAAIAATEARQASLTSRLRTLGEEAERCKAALARVVAYGADRDPRSADELHVRLAAIAREQDASTEAQRLLAADLERLRADRVPVVRAEADATLTACLDELAGVVAQLHAAIVPFARDVVLPGMQAALVAERRVRQARQQVQALGGEADMRTERGLSAAWAPLPEAGTLARLLASYVPTDDGSAGKAG